MGQRRGKKGDDNKRDIKGSKEERQKKGKLRERTGRKRGWKRKNRTVQGKDIKIERIRGRKRRRNKGRRKMEGWVSKEEIRGKLNI